MTKEKSQIEGNIANNTENTKSINNTDYMYKKKKVSKEEILDFGN